MDLAGPTEVVRCLIDGEKPVRGRVAPKADLDAVGRVAVEGSHLGDVESQGGEYVGIGVAALAAVHAGRCGILFPSGAVIRSVTKGIVAPFDDIYPL
jgi:hypothetical protein